jgi:hypothetical protein
MGPLPQLQPWPFSIVVLYRKSFLCTLLSALFWQKNTSQNGFGMVMDVIGQIAVP